MTRLPMSPAAAALLRALIARAGVTRDRILLSHIRSTDWQSLTLIGERHHFELTLMGIDAGEAARRLAEGIEEAEFHLSGQIVADIACASMEPRADGGVSVAIEALTVEE